MCTLFGVKSQGSGVAWAGPLDGSSQGAYQQVVGGKDVQSVDRLIPTEFTPLSVDRHSHIGGTSPESGQGKSTQVGGERRQEEVTSNFNPQTTSKYWTNHLNEDDVLCQEAFNKRLPVCCFGSVRNPLALINSWRFRNYKRRGTPFLGLRNPGISYYSDKYLLPFYEPYGKKWLLATLSLIGIALCFVNL